MLFLLGVVIESYTIAQKTLTPEMLIGMHKVGTPVASSDGSTLLFSVSKTNIAANKTDGDLYTMPTLGGSPTKITAIPGNEWNYVWHPLGKKIAFISAFEGSPQMYEAGINGTNVQRVTNVEGGISGFIYNADGSTIAYTADVTIEKSLMEQYPDLNKANVLAFDNLMYRHWDSWTDYSYSHVFVSKRNADGSFAIGNDVMPGEAFDSPLAPFGGSEQIAFSANGRKLVYTCKKLIGKDAATSTNSELYEYDLASGKTINLTEKGYNSYDANPAFSSDGKFMAWLSMARNGFEADKNDIIMRDLQSGIDKNLTKETDITVSSFIWSTNNQKIYFEATVEATQQLFEIDLKSGKISQITKGDHNYTSLVQAGDFLIGNRNDMIVPSEIYRVELKTGKQIKLSSFNDALVNSLDKPTFEKRWIETSDGKKMLTWVVFPPNFDKSKKYPTLLYCQGGPQSAVSQTFSFRWNFHLMAAQGYIIVAPNRRGLPGFGQEWNDAISGDWGGQAIRDYLSAIDAVAKEPWVNKEKMGSVGASYGGYSVYQLAGVHEKRFKCFISHCGLFNMESWYGTTEEVFFANWDLGGPYWQTPQPKSYTEFSPHKLVDKWDTPIMVIHGEKDFRVPINQGIEAFQAAQLRNIPSRFLYFPAEGHWVMSAQNSMIWHTEFYKWLDQWLN